MRTPGEVAKSEGAGADWSSTQSPIVELEYSESGLRASESEQLPEDVLKKGNLTKSSQHRRNDPRPGPKQKRKFRLTAESLEYLQPFSHVSFNFVSNDHGIINELP